MNLIDHFYANFFTVGALIPTAFDIFLAYIFFSVKDKSKPTFHLGIAFLYLAIFNFGYFIASGFYHPNAAFHRWITVGFIMLHLTHVNMFMLNIHKEINAKYSRIFLILQYAVSLAVFAVFFLETINADKIFVISAHHWDFNADEISSSIGILIIAYLIVFSAITFWKIISIKGRVRYLILFIGISYLIGSIIPSFANVLSRDGILDRGTFQVLWDLFSLAGLYFMVIGYLNYTQDRFPLMAKIVSIIMVTIMMILQGFSYYSFQDNEKSFDAIHQSYTEMSIAAENQLSDTYYITEYSAGSGSFSTKFWKDNSISKIDFSGFKNEYLNAAVYENISSLSDDGFNDKIKILLQNTHPGFKGYKNAISGNIIKTSGNNKKNQKKNLLKYLLSIQTYIHYNYNKIHTMPDEQFRNTVSEYLKKTGARFNPFKSAIEEYLQKEKSEGLTLKNGVLSFLSPIGAPDQRHYRSIGNYQFISYLHADRQKNAVYETGFSYEAYREYMHPSALMFILSLFIILAVIIFGFNLFFRGILIMPLHRLINGLQNISQGKFDTQIPVKFGDEIGFVSSSFNLMADTIRQTKASLDDYTNTLEQKVEERTHELAQSEEKYRSIIDAGIIGYFEVDLHGNFTFFNKSFQEYTRYSHDELMSMNFRQIVHDEDIQQILSDFGKVFTGITLVGNFILRAIWKNGEISYGDNYVSVKKNSAGNIIGFRSVVLDITAREKAEEALRESEEKYRTFVEKATDGIFRNDIRGNFLYVNPSGLNLLGYNEAELLKMNFRDVLIDESREFVMNNFRTQLKEKLEETYIEFPVIRKDGSIRWLGQITKLIKLRGDTFEFHGISRDVTDHKKAEDARNELEEQKTRFFANISHEIRTPLTLMISPIESVLQGDYGKEINRAFFDNLYRNGLRLLKLVNNLLDFSKIEAGRMKMKVCEVDLVVFLRNYISAVNSAAESKGITITFSSDSDKVPAYIDLDKMDKVIMNLFSNSLKFTENEGSISIRIKNDDLNCCIEFKDTGEGIPSQSIDSIFDRFSQADTSATRRHEGTGIGLALARELVEMHGGTIRVESRYIKDNPSDHGSLFTISIPLGREHFEGIDFVEFISENDLDDMVSDHSFFGMREMHDLAVSTDSNSTMNESVGKLEDINNDYTAPEHAAGSQSPASVLIVDDNPDMRDFLSYLLKKHYTVHLAENGKAGLEAADRISPDLIITDVMMPVMDGHELTRLLKSNPKHKHIPVIMLTAKAEMTHKLEGFEQGADDFLTKPFNSKELLARIRTLLKTREYEKEISLRNEDIEQEMEVARQLQQRLLPEQINELPGYNYHALYIPMDKVGGDFYDYTLRDQYIDLFIADVSGHGLPGAFLAMMTKMSLESATERKSTNSTLAQINDVICRSTVNSNHVTAFLGRIDTATNIIRFSNAGHLPPLVYRMSSGEFFELNAKGMPLGWFREYKIEEKEFQLLPADRLILFTDGITECIDPLENMFGEDGFREFISSNRNISAESFCEILLANLYKFSGKKTFEDDLTLVVFDVL